VAHYYFRLRTAKTPVLSTVIFSDCGRMGADQQCGMTLNAIGNDP
jgi:hypothetical protein